MITYFFFFVGFFKKALVFFCTSRFTLAVFNLKSTCFIEEPYSLNSSATVSSKLAPVLRFALQSISHILPSLNSTLIECKIIYRYSLYVYIFKNFRPMFDYIIR